MVAIFELQATDARKDTCFLPNPHRKGEPTNLKRVLQYAVGQLLPQYDTQQNYSQHFRGGHCSPYGQNTSRHDSSKLEFDVRLCLQCRRFSALLPNNRLLVNSTSKSRKHSRHPNTRDSGRGTFVAARSCLCHGTNLVESQWKVLNQQGKQKLLLSFENF